MRDFPWPEFRFYRYELPLVAPLRLSSGLLETRRGLLVCCRREGAKGWGEIAPLDGYSRETLAGVLDLLPATAQSLRARRMPSLDEAPSLRCGLEFALENYRAAASGRSFYQALGGQPGPAKLIVARLITNTNDVAIEHAHVAEAIRDGYAGLKIKVGGRPVRDDVARVQSLLAAIPAEVHVRLDANRGWTIEEALEFCRAMPPGRIEFVEEPLADFHDYSTFNRGQELPFALDESLREVRPQQLPDWERLRYLVLKPSLLGGLSASREWIDWASGRGITPVISSMFESGVGIRCLAALAGTLPAHKAGMVAAGLDTLSYLADDVVNPRLALSRGSLDLSPIVPGTWDVDIGKLDFIE